MLISVVIPVYNKENYIANTLNKVLMQTYTDFEILVVDDGSTDASENIVKSFSDSRITLIKQQNQGVSVARNTGIKHAIGEFIALLDADDYWAPNFLEEMVNAINHYPEFDIFAAGRTSVFDNQSLRYYHYLLPKEGETAQIDYIKIIASYLPPLNSSNGVIKKETFMQSGGFSPGQKNHEDHTLWLKMMTTRNLIFVNKPLCFYLKNVPESASGNALRFVDYCQYLRTIKETALQISPERHLFFKRYYNQFIIFSFIRYQDGFSKMEQNEIATLVAPMLTSWNSLVFKLTKALPSGFVYRCIRFIKN